MVITLKEVFAVFVGFALMSFFSKHRRHAIYNILVNLLLPSVCSWCGKRKYREHNNCYSKIRWANLTPSPAPPKPWYVLLGEGYAIPGQLKYWTVELTIKDSPVIRGGSGEIGCPMEGEISNGR